MKYLSLIGDEQFISFRAQRSTSFQILYCVWVRYTRTPNQTLHGNKDWDGSNHLWNTETLTELTASQWNSSGRFSQDTIRCSSVKKSKVYYARHQRISQEESYSCRCSTTSPVDQEKMKKNASQMLNSFFSFCKEIWKRTMVIHWSWFREKSGILSVQIVHKVNGTELPRR